MRIFDWLRPSRTAFAAFVSRRWEADKRLLRYEAYFEERLTFVSELLGYYDHASVRRALGDQAEEIINYLQEVKDSMGSLPRDEESQMSTTAAA